MQHLDSTPCCGPGGNHCWTIWAYISSVRRIAAAVQYYLAYHLFGLLWTNQVIVGFGYVVIAHCIAQYYWTRGIRSEMSTFPVLTGIYTAARYHMGSIAFGAFIVAVIQFVRLVLEYLDRKTKKLQQNNPAARWAMCCLRYCLWCALPAKAVCCGYCRQPLHPHTKRARFSGFLNLEMQRITVSWNS